MLPKPDERVKERLLTTRIPSPAPEGKPISKKDEKPTPKSDDFNEYDYSDSTELDDTQW